MPQAAHWTLSYYYYYSLGRPGGRYLQAPPGYSLGGIDPQGYFYYLLGGPGRH